MVEAYEKNTFADLLKLLRTAIQHTNMADGFFSGVERMRGLLSVVCLGEGVESH